MKNQPLKYKLVSGVVTVSIGVSTLAHAIQNGPSASNAKILNEDELARAILQALQDEDEDGTQPFHRILDDAFEKAAEFGTSVDPDLFMQEVSE